MSPQTDVVLKPRTKPMEVLVLGMCRTATMSTKTALEQLGYDAYHMKTIFDTPGDAEKWQAALEGKYAKNGVPWTRAQFDDIVGDYSAVTDVPNCCFAPELIKLYPEAKIILTTRSVDSWYASMLSTIAPALTSPFFNIARLGLGSHAPPIMTMLHYWFDVYFYGNFERFGKRVFEEHNSNVKHFALSEAPDRFLEFQAADGWKPLCEFLGKPVPAGDFPRVNDAAEFKQRVSKGHLLAMMAKVGMVVMFATPVFFGSNLLWKRVSGLS